MLPRIRLPSRPPLLGIGGERRNPPILRVDNQRRAPALHHTARPIAPEFVVRPPQVRVIPAIAPLAIVVRVGRALILPGFFFGKERLISQIRRPLEWSNRRVGPNPF